jgi:hypothetical protein
VCPGTHEGGIPVPSVPGWAVYTEPDNATSVSSQRRALASRLMPDRRRTRRTPRWNSLVAAAQVMTAPNASLQKVNISRPQYWQTAAWDYYDIVGELRFAVTWISNAMSRVNLVAAMPPLGPGDEPTPIDFDDPRTTEAQRRAYEIVQGMAGGAAGQSAIMAAFGTQLSVAGIGWLVIEPSLDDPTSDRFVTWEVYSSDEVRSAVNDDTIEIRISEREWRPVHPNAIVIKCWRRHPRRTWEPDAPTHGVLGVLREIDLLQKHIHASAQSRLAGAGLLAIPAEAVFPPGQGPQSSIENIDPDDQNITPPEDTFVETLVDSMTTPISDRGSAAAVVPLVVKIPGEYVDKIRHISFATPFDAKVLELLESSIRRLALGMDIPPEILTGTSGMNHWGAWQVQEESITLHIEPLSEVVTHALTVGFLRPALEAEGFDASDLMVWYDTTDLRTRPDRSSGAVQAYDRAELSGTALLRELGLSVDDAPDDDERRQRILLNAMSSLPSAAPVILAELGLLDATKSDTIPVQARVPATVEEVVDESASPTQGPPDTAPSSGEPIPDPTASITDQALVAACDVLVYRALEKAGSRLRSAAGKNVQGGAASIPCADPTRLHCEIEPTMYADLGALLDGAWSLAPAIAERCGTSPDALIETLDAYTRALLASGQPHDYDRLSDALGLRSTV